MRLDQWQKKEWPGLNDLELEDLCRFRVTAGTDEFLLSDPEFLATYLVGNFMLVVIPTWSFLRRYNHQFLELLRAKLEKGYLVDDIGVLEEALSGDYLYKIDDQVLRVPPAGFNGRIEEIRNLLLLKTPGLKVVDRRMLSVWNTKINRDRDSKKPIPMPAWPQVRQMPAVGKMLIHNIEVALDLSGDSKFKTAVLSERFGIVYAGGYRILIRGAA
ncbi:MAG: hypothetical protein PHQ23_04140 [Candidatus Wallbacteria bacterium]|nr:hypothetical protein [Candidatus Wallbacteria bacterium]